MKYGMPTLVECKTLDECAELAAELSLDFVEINTSFPEYVYGNFDTAHACELAEKYGIFYTIHADEALNPFDFNPKVSKVYFEIMKDTIKIAKEIKAKAINLHLQKGIYVTLPQKVILLTDVYHDIYIESVKSFIKMCECELLGTDIKIVIENVDTNAFSTSQIDALELFMKSEFFGLTLDTGHECKLKFVDLHIYEKYPEKLWHMHLHDCKAGSPHLPLGTGEVEIENRLACLKGENCLLEVKTVAGLRESVKYIKDKEL